MNTKVCNVCNNEFPLTSEYFYKKSDAKDGFRNYCKECSKAKIREYCSNNKERMRQYHKERAKNTKIKRTRKEMTDYEKEKARIKSKKYYDENKDKIKERRKKKRQEASSEDKLKQSLKMAEYYQKNKETIIEKVEAYRHTEKGSEVKRMCSQKRRTLKNNLISTLDAEQLKHIWHIFNNSCAYCGMSEEEHFKIYNSPLHQEHFIPLSKGGAYTIDNIIPACKSCNCSKSIKDFFKWYPTYIHYNSERERFILKYLGYTNEIAL